MSELLLDAAGRRRSPATLPDFHAGRAPRNKGIRYPADPPTVEEIIAVMRGAGDGVHGRRLHGLIVVLWRAGLRIHEALALAEADLDARRGSLLVRRGKGGRRRPLGAPPPRPPDRRAATLRPAPAAPRPRRRDCARGLAADRHPTPTRPHHLGITSIYLQGIDNAEIIDTVHARRAPMVPVHSSLRV